MHEYHSTGCTEKKANVSKYMVLLIIMLTHACIIILGLSLCNSINLSSLCLNFLIFKMEKITEITS